MPNSGESAPDAAAAARQLASRLEKRQQPYALGGAIALGYWGAPRGTVDVDLTLFIPPDQPMSCLRVLQQIGCEVDASRALASLEEHGFCQVRFEGLRVDVFVPTLPFYDVAHRRRRRVSMGSQPIMIWDAEVLCVFKMLFFRRKDLADVEQILRTQGEDLDRQWVRARLEEICGKRDPRLTEWQDLCTEADG